MTQSKPISIKIDKTPAQKCIPLNEPMRLFREDSTTQETTQIGYITDKPFSSYSQTIDQIYEDSTYFRVPLYFNFDPLNNTFCSYEVITNSRSDGVFLADQLIRQDQRDTPRLYGLPTDLRSDSSTDMYDLQFIIGIDQATYTVDMTDLTKWYFVGERLNAKRHTAAVFSLAHLLKEEFLNKNSKFYKKENEKPSPENDPIFFTKEEVEEEISIFFEWLMDNNPGEWALAYGNIYYMTVDEMLTYTTDDRAYMFYYRKIKKPAFTQHVIDDLARSKYVYPKMGLVHEEAHYEVDQQGLRHPSSNIFLYSIFTLLYRDAVGKEENFSNFATWSIHGIYKPFWGDELQAYAKEITSTLRDQSVESWEELTKNYDSQFKLYEKYMDGLFSGWYSTDALLLSAEHFRLTTYNTTTDPVYEEIIALFQDDFNYRVECTKKRVRCEFPSPAMRTLLSLAYCAGSTTGECKEAAKIMRY